MRMLQQQRLAKIIEACVGMDKRKRNRPVFISKQVFYFQTRLELEVQEFSKDKAKVQP